ncbi:hypothetical protein V8C86DRAFT_3034898 [Haematococcus lacustris]
MCLISCLKSCLKSCLVGVATKVKSCLVGVATKMVEDVTVYKQGTETPLDTFELPANCAEAWEAMTTLYGAGVLKWTNEGRTMTLSRSRPNLPSTGKLEWHQAPSEAREMERRVHDIKLPDIVGNLSLSNIHRLLKPAFVAQATMMMLQLMAEEPNIDVRYTRIESSLFEGRLAGSRECRDAVYVLHNHVLSAMSITP